MISVLVADDHGVVREGLRRLLDAEPGFEVCGEARDGREALEQAEAHHPDCVVLDISMPRLGGLETLQRLRAQHPGMRVVLLSVNGAAPVVEKAVALGAEGYVLKQSDPSEVIEAVRAVSRGDNYFSPPVARELVKRLRGGNGHLEGNPFAILSTREREVLQLVAEGMSAKEIAGELRISTKTVEAHRTSLMRKVGVRKATELVRYACKHGLVEP